VASNGMILYVFSIVLFCSKIEDDSLFAMSVESAARLVYFLFLGLKKQQKKTK
jgi:hypothetical protein